MVGGREVEYIVVTYGRRAENTGGGVVYIAAAGTAAAGGAAGVGSAPQRVAVKAVCVVLVLCGGPVAER